MSASTQTYGSRYAVIERVGTGGMAAVYRARDELLGRDVALKVLSERLSRDGSFGERFRREAQSAANLNHPNIVSLYDYGADNDTYFIVMEYIDGRTLADIIRDEGPLLPERAAEIAADVAAALSRAHNADLVHRDIKPANIMITSSGQTKVTDFGIARALTRGDDQTVTQTGMVIGTAAYLSPEQAQGNPVDARSDVYSLGCVLYEMLTGRAPFSGDTPLAIAYKHVRESAPPPSSANSDVPPELDAVIMKSMSKNPDNRYSSATEMKQDLDRFLSGQRVEATPVLADDTLATPGTSQTQVLRQTDYIAPSEQRRRGGLWYVGLALLILALFGVAAWLLFNNLLGQDVTVPPVKGLTVDQAVEVLQGRGLDSNVQRRFSGRPINEVLGQRPAAGTRVEEGATVTLIVSKGRKQVAVPDVSGLTRARAEERLEDANLTVGEISRQPSDTVAPGRVISQLPTAGTKVDARSAVDLVISSGPATVTVPGVIGQTEASATGELGAAGFGVSVVYVTSEEAQGIVINQVPGAGAQAEPGSTVQITVSQGPPEPTAPPSPTPTPTVTTTP